MSNIFRSDIQGDKYTEHHNQLIYSPNEFKATKLLRKAGLCQRMPEGREGFARQINLLCIEMTNTRRKSDGRKARKAILRKMKPLLKTIAGHAQRHRDLLEADWASTNYSHVQARQIIEDRDGEILQEGAEVAEGETRTPHDMSVSRGMEAGSARALYNISLQTISGDLVGNAVKNG